uniref:Uncharacterized protein n=1 Tax=Aegilops tauschii subsp. strangulata TaxID=200361 RepID=A0A453BR12_AEGTS
MGKGRSCRYGSERLLYPVQASGHHVAGGADHLADLDEEDVWSVLAARRRRRCSRAWGGP